MSDQNKPSSHWLLAPTRSGKPVTSKAYRDRLAAKIREVAEEGNVPADRIRKKVAFDFVLLRLHANSRSTFVLKGGYALEIRLQVGRSTKDLDFVARGIQRSGIDGKGPSQAAVLRKLLVDGLADAVDEADAYISFRVDEGAAEIKGGGGGTSFSIKMLVDGQVFEEFYIDLTLEDIERADDSIQMVTTIPIYPGSEAVDVASIAPEQHFAEKLHAYTRPRGEHENSRVKDLIDLFLLARIGLEQELTKKMVHSVFDYWQTHPVPAVSDIEQPPESWVQPFAKLAREVGIDIGSADAFKVVIQKLDEIFG